MEVKSSIAANANSKKAPGKDLINGKIIKELPKKGIASIASIFNAILRLSYYPTSWKITIITLIHKPGKLTNKNYVISTNQSFICSIQAA